MIRASPKAKATSPAYSWMSRRGIRRPWRSHTRGGRQRRTAARGAKDDPGRKHLGSDDRLLVDDSGIQSFRSQPPKVMHRLAHRRQTRRDVAGGQDVIPTCDRQIIRNMNSVVLQSLHDGERERVVAADEPVDLHASAQDLLRN